MRLLDSSDFKSSVSFSGDMQVQRLALVNNTHTHAHTHIHRHTKALTFISLQTWSQGLSFFVLSTSFYLLIWINFATSCIRHVEEYWDSKVFNHFVLLPSPLTALPGSEVPFMLFCPTLPPAAVQGRQFLLGIVLFRYRKRELGLNLCEADFLPWMMWCCETNPASHIL